MKYELNFRNNRGSDEDLLADLKRVARLLNSDKLTMRDYDELGKYSSPTLKNRFGSWNSALEKADLHVSINHNLNQKELFKNLEEVWIKLGKQPQRRDMKKPVSRFSERGYITMFGSWSNALESFVSFINSPNSETEVHLKSDATSKPTQPDEYIYKHITKRQPSERLKVQVLMREGNRCKLCGRTLIGDEIHFDHVFPWSKGGETILDNLQILCSKHNLAKSDLEYPSM